VSLVINVIRSCQNCRFASEGTLSMTYLVHCVLNKCTVDSFLVRHVASYTGQNSELCTLSTSKLTKCSGKVLCVVCHEIIVQADVYRAQIYISTLLMDLFLHR
jgi:hypothetical protein